MRDGNGNIVITQLNEQMCQEIAAAGKGIYVRADNTNSALRALQSEINKMDKAELESKVYSEYDERFQTLAWIVLILLILEYLILERKNRIFRKKIAFYEKIPGTDWTIVSYLNKTEAFSQIYALRNTVILISVGLLFLASVMGYLIARPMVSSFDTVTEVVKK